MRSLRTKWTATPLTSRSQGTEDFDHCSELFTSLALSYSASFLTAVINVVLATTIRKTAKWQLWKSRSTEEAVCLVATFAAQFCNTCVILVLVELDWVALVGFNFWQYIPGMESQTDTTYYEGARSHFGLDW
jgi:hypothetical protein